MDLKEKCNQIKKLIEENTDIVEFADFGDGVSETWIRKCESRLGVTLPPTYKWWLKNYGGGEICGEEIFSIYEKDFDEVVGGDIVYMHEWNQKKKLFSKDQIVICETDDEAFFFDISQPDEDEEYPVFSDSDFFAKNFLEFLEKRIHFFKQ